MVSTLLTITTTEDILNFQRTQDPDFRSRRSRSISASINVFDAGSITILNNNLGRKLRIFRLIVSLITTAIHSSEIIR